MKKDTTNRAGTKRVNSAAAPIGDPKPIVPSARRESGTQITCSTRYIDSRLKQFCLR